MVFENALFRFSGPLSILVIECTRRRPSRWAASRSSAVSDRQVIPESYFEKIHPSAGQRLVAPDSVHTY